MHLRTQYTHTYHNRGKVPIRKKDNLDDRPPGSPDILDLPPLYVIEEIVSGEGSAHLFRQGKEMIVD